MFYNQKSMPNLNCIVIVFLHVLRFFLCLKHCNKPLRCNVHESMTCCNIEIVFFLIPNTCELARNSRENEGQNIVCNVNNLERPNFNEHTFLKVIERFCWLKSMRIKEHAAQFCSTLIIRKFSYICQLYVSWLTSFVMTNIQ